MWKYGTELLETLHPISFHRDLDTWCHAVGNQMVEITKPNINR